MAVPSVTCSADIELAIDTSTRLVQLGATATNSPTAWEWTLLSVPPNSTAMSGVKGDFNNGIATVQNPELLIDGLVSGDEVDGTYVLQCVASNGEGPSNPLTDKENAQQLILVLTEELSMPVPNDYAWDWGKKYLNEALRFLESRSSDVKCSATDASRDTLEGKLAQGSNITITKVDVGGGVEKMQISSAGGGTFLILTDTPANYVGSASKYVRVNSAPDGLEFVAFDELFTALSDTPANYTGSGGKLLRVNATPDGVEFVDLTFLLATDTPSSYSGQAGKAVVVKGAEDGLEFGTIAATDEKAKASSDDDTADFLDQKLVAGANISVTKIGGSTKQLSIAATASGSIQGEDAIADSVGTEVELALSQTPVAAAGRPSGRACDVYRNGVLMTHVATLGTDKMQWHYDATPKVQFVASGSAHDRYVAIYWY